MTSHRAVKSYKKSSVPGVNIAQFVDKIPEGCSTPDFERKPVTLTLQEGKNAIFRAVVKGVPTPEVKWRRAKGEMDDPDKYEIFFNKVINEYVLKINKLTVDDTDVYRCFAVNEYGEATCSAGLRIIQVGFKRKAQYVPAQSADELKKKLQDLRKLLRKRAPVPKQKTLDKEAIFQLLLHADRRDYEKICIKYGISDFRGMLRKLQEMRRDAESEQGELIHSIKNMQHIKVNKDGTATFVLEMDLKNSNSKIYLLKDGERLRYGTGDEYRKHYLRRIGKRYNFIVNDVQPEDAGLYQVRVEEVPVFSTELDAESIPVRFQQPLSDVRCPEKGNAVFECTLRSPCYDAVWLHKTHPLEASEKHQISMTPDGLTHQLVINDVVASDNGMYTLDTGLCSSNAYLLVEYPKGKKRQDEGGEKEKSDWRKETLTDKDGAKKPKRREHLSDKDHLTDAGMEKDDWYRNGQEGSQGYSTDVDEGYIFLGKEGLRKTYRDGTMGPGQFSGAERDGESMTDDDSNRLKILGGKKGLRAVHSQDSMTGRANTDDRAGGADEWCSVDGRDEGMLDAVDIDMDDAEGMDSWHDKNYKVGDNSSRAGFGGIKRLGATDGSSVLDGLDPDSTRVGDKHSLYGKDDMLGGTRSGKNAAGTETAGGMRSPYSKDGLPTVAGVNGVGIKREGETGALYGKDGLTVDAGGHVGQAGRSGLLYGPGGLSAGDGARTGAGGSSAGEMGVLYGPDGLPVGADVNDATAGKMGGFYGKHGQSGSPYGKDGLPAGVGIGGAGGIGSPYGKDGLPVGMGTGAGIGGAGVGGLGGAGSPYGKDGLPAGAGVGGAGAGGFGGAGSPYGKDGFPGRAGTGIGGAGVGGFGGAGSPYGKDGLPAGAGAGIGGAGAGGFGGGGSPYGKDGLPAGAGTVAGGAGAGGLGGVGSPYGKDGLPVGMGPGAAGAGIVGAGASGLGGVGSPYGKDGLPAGVGGAGAGGAGGVGSPYGKDGLPAGAGVGGAGVGGLGGVGSPYGKDGLPAGAGIGGAGAGGFGGVGSPYGKDGLPAGAGVGGAGVGGLAGVGSPYGMDGLPAGVGGAGAGGFGGIGSPYGKDGLPAGAGVGGAGASGLGGVGSPYGKNGLPAGAGTVAGGAGVGGFGGVGSPYGKDGLPAGAGAGIGGAGVGGLGGVGSPYGKDGLPAGAGTGVGGAGAGGLGGVESPYGKDGLPAGAGVGGAGAGGFGGVGSPYGKDGLPAGAGTVAGGAGAGGLGGVGSPYGKDGLPAGAGAGIGGAGASGLGGVGSPYGKDGLPAGAGAGIGGTGASGLGGIGSPYGKDGLPAGAGAGVGGAGAGGLGGVGSPYGKDGLPAGAGAGVGGAGAGGLGGVGSPYGKDGLPAGAGAGIGGAGAGGLGGVGSPYGKDGLPAGAGAGVGGAGAGGFGGVGSPYGKDGLPAGAGAGVGGAGAGGFGGVGSPYGKDGLPAGAGAGIGGAGAGGFGGVGSPYGKDGLPAGAGAGVGGAGAGGFGGVGSPYGKDGLPAGAGAAGAGVGGAGAGGFGGAGSPYGKDGLPAGAGAGVSGSGLAGAGGVGSPYGKDGFPAGAGIGGAGVAGLGGVGSPYGKGGLPVGMGTGAGVGGAGAGGFGGVGSPYGKDGLPAQAGGSITSARGAGSSYGRDGLSSGAAAGVAHFPFGGEEVTGSHHGRDAGLSSVQGYGGGAGGAGLSSEGRGVGGSAIQGAGSAYGKDGGSAGGRAGGGGVGRLGGDGKELHSAWGTEGMAGAVGIGGKYGLDLCPGKSARGEAGKGTAGDFRGPGHKGSSHDEESDQRDGRGEDRDLGRLGSCYGKDSAAGGAGSKSHNRLGDRGKPGVFGQGSPGYDQTSNLYGGPSSINQRKQLPSLDIKTNDFLKNTESTEKRGHYRLDDLRAPRCHVNKQLIDVRVRKGEPAELSCAVNKEDVTATWFKDGLKLTSMDGVLFEKQGLVHKLIFSKVEDIHAGKYRFEAGDIKTEASIFVEDPPQVDKVLLKNLTSVPTVAKAGEKIKIKVPFEGRLPVRATWLKDKMELADDSRIRVDKTDTYTMLSISNTERKDRGDYKVRLKNDSGILDIDLKVEVTDKPQPPAGPMKIVESSANDITIQWKPPKDDGGKPVQSYIVERQQVGEGDWVALGEIPRSCTTFTTNKVERDMSYYFRVRAVNAEGTSDALESEEVKAVSKATPGAPDPPEIISVSKDTITISWKTPRRTGSSRIVGYIIQKRKKGTMTWVPVNSVPIADKKLKMTNLKKGLQYEFCVAAVNASGVGDISAPSQPVFARDSTKPPGQVRDLAVTSSDSTSVTLTWKRPEVKDGNDVKGYDVEVRSSNNLDWTRCNVLPIEMTSYTVKGLKNKELYFLRVRALNDCGPGEAAELEAFTEADSSVVSPRFLIDDTVKNLLIIKAGNAIRMDIPFEASPDPQVTWLKDGLPLSNRATISTKDGTSQLLIKAAELTDSGTYTIELKNGSGKRETFSFQVQVTDIPQNPGPILLQENVPNAVTVTWEPSASEKWESNLYYTVLKRESQKGLWHVVGDLIYTNKFTYTKVIPGRDYYFRVVAKNELGTSGPSETVQPWRIKKTKAEVHVRPQKYRGVNQNQPPRFLVPLKPHVVTTGSECRMSCAVAGHPPPKITWYKDSRDLSSDPAYFGTNDFGVCSLVIQGVSKADEGEYMVEAANELGRVFTRAFLAIKGNNL
ncbi:immunoglobulin-like and fibronectin type III domain-containing protein 1 [Cygnus olor]|uniref:immunoglobulin-like and fibronectin type III domain-containing protein 1 n=1 Tax=Cygnus olor TaxID=8869 RepID=UPI001ADE0563|nr:immunoglobulin-like and fibronectin type III domain-containing protein 1 [Cygnus olor]